MNSVPYGPKFERTFILDTDVYINSGQVVDAACGDRSPEIHNANMFDMNAKYADVVTEEEAIEHLGVPGRA